MFHFDNQTVSAGNDYGIGRMFYSDFNMRNLYDGVSDTLFEYDAARRRITVDGYEL